MSLNFSIKINGHVKIFDSTSINVDKSNHINVKNMLTVIGRGLAGLENANIFKIKVGNGGITQDGSFKELKISQNDNDLYNPLNLYSIILDSSNPNHVEGNSTTITSSANNTISIVNIAVVNRQLSENDPLEINELALFSEDDLMLSHLIFSPVQILPGSNKKIIYTVSFDINGP